MRRKQIRRTLRTAKRLQYCLTKRNPESLSRLRPKRSTKQSRCYERVTFHFSNSEKLAAKNFELGSTNGAFGGQLPRFTTSGGTQSAVQLNKTKAFRACD